MRRIWPLHFEVYYFQNVHTLLLSIKKKKKKTTKNQMTKLQRIRPEGSVNKTLLAQQRNMGNSKA